MLNGPSRSCGRATPPEKEEVQRFQTRGARNPMPTRYTVLSWQPANGCCLLCPLHRPQAQLANCTRLFFRVKYPPD